LKKVQKKKHFRFDSSESEEEGRVPALPEKPLVRSQPPPVAGPSKITPRKIKPDPEIDESWMENMLKFEDPVAEPECLGKGKAKMQSRVDLTVDLDPGQKTDREGLTSKKM
jgi:hypothetical protein